jgi:hypothetical protein
VTPFFFSIPLAPKRDERSWRRISSLLADTLASLQQQTDGDWQAVIAGNEKPDIAEFDDPRVMFISVETRMPGAYNEKIADQHAKRAAAFEHIRRAGGGYVMMLDADDLVHRELVAFVRKDGNPFGYVFDQGYVENYPTGSLEAVPMRDGTRFHRICGSCAVFRLTPEDIGQPGHAVRSYMDRLGPHPSWALVSSALDRPLSPVPFPAAIYRFNTGAQISKSRRGLVRYWLMGLRIEVRRIRGDARQIRRDFLPSGR